MSSGAKLFTVTSVRSTVFVVQDPARGLLWTERTEQAARDLAAEKGLPIVEEASITHAEFMRMMGHEQEESVPLRAKPGQPEVGPGAATKTVEPASAQRFGDEVLSASLASPASLNSAIPAVNAGTGMISSSNAARMSSGFDTSLSVNPAAAAWLSPDEPEEEDDVLTATRPAEPVKGSVAGPKATGTAGEGTAMPPVALRGFADAPIHIVLPPPDSDEQ